MRKMLLIIFFFLSTIMALYSQSVNRDAYYPIDPYDYKLSIESAKPGSVRYYKSTVLFLMQMGTSFSFQSLDELTPIAMDAKKRFKEMHYGQKVTIYYTATRNQYVASDTLVLDHIEY